MFGKIKKGMGDVKASADIETEYLMAKNKNNFDHPAENGVRIKAYLDAFTAADDFVDRIKAWTDKYQDLINGEIKMLEKMNASASLASLSSIFSTFSGAHNNVIQLRQQHLGKIIEYIQTPGKKFISDQTPIKNKIDQTNKAWIELRYWKKKGGKISEEKDAQQAYDAHIEALFKMFDTNIDAQVAQWVKYFADFEVEFFTNAASVAPRV